MPPPPPEPHAKRRDRRPGRETSAAGHESARPRDTRERGRGARGSEAAGHEGARPRDTRVRGRGDDPTRRRAAALRDEQGRGKERDAAGRRGTRDEKAGRGGTIQLVAAPPPRRATVAGVRPRGRDLGPGQGRGPVERVPLPRRESRGGHRRGRGVYRITRLPADGRPRIRRAPARGEPPRAPERRPRQAVALLRIRKGRGPGRTRGRAKISLVLRRGYSAETSRGDAAAATWLIRGDASRRRRGCDADIPRRRTAAERRGYSAEMLGSGWPLRPLEPSRGRRAAPPRGAARIFRGPRRRGAGAGGLAEEWCLPRPRVNAARRRLRLAGFGMRPQVLAFQFADRASADRFGAAVRRAANAAAERRASFSEGDVLRRRCVEAGFDGRDVREALAVRRRGAEGISARLRSTPGGPHRLRARRNRGARALAYAATETARVERGASGLQRPRARPRLLWRRLGRQLGERRRVRERSKGGKTPPNVGLGGAAGKRAARRRAPLRGSRSRTTSSTRSRNARGRGGRRWTRYVRRADLPVLTESRWIVRGDGVAVDSPWRTESRWIVRGGRSRGG